MTPARIREKSIFVYKMDFQTVRLYGSIAIILGCFIFLYPKLLHPLLSTMFGGAGSAKGNEMDDFVPPPLRNRNPNMGSDPKSDIPDNIRRSMRHGPHPGMRAQAAEQSKQAKGSGRGMMGVILPMYAIGIVVYLVYTLCKVFNKKDGKSTERRSPSTVQRTQQQSFVNDDVGSEEEAELDMRKLQERLAETEAQMTKILSAMKAVQGKVGDVTADNILQAQHDLDTMATPGAQGGGAEDRGDQPQGLQPATHDSSAESTPDSESYEIINKSNGENNNAMRPETVGSRTSEAAAGAGEEQEDSGEETQNTEETDEATNDSGEEEDEVEEVMMTERQDSDDQQTRTVRKRQTQHEHTPS